MNREILHVDADAFYASVEVLHRPRLRGLPVAVGGDVEARHGIILAKTYEAKKYGIKTGNAIWAAKKLCPDLIVLPPDYAKYQRFSRMLRELLSDYTPLCESFGPDEAWIDVTGTTQTFGSGPEIADKIRRRVEYELGITVSVGSSWNKVFAKAGSDMHKPNGQTDVTRENYKQTVWTLPVDDLLYVGHKRAKALHSFGIHRIGDLASMSPEWMQCTFQKWGLVLHSFANGLDVSPVMAIDDEPEIQTIGNSTTTPRDLLDEADCYIVFYNLAESVAMRLRESGLKGRTVQISLRDTKLQCLNRQMTLPKETFLANELTDAAIQLLRKHYHWELPLRSVGVRAMNLAPANEIVQYSFFEDAAKRMQREIIECTMDEIRGRFGFSSIGMARMGVDKQLGKINAKDEHVMVPGIFSF